MTSGRRNQVHFELFAKKTPSSGWALQLASEDREQIIAEASELFSSKHMAAVKVTKEAFDQTTGEFSSIVLLSLGTLDSKKKPKRVYTDAVCTSPHDLYTPLAREKISTLLEGYLKRNSVSAFELLHRPDLVERLDASGNEMQHVAQKLAVPEAQETGQSLHTVIRRWIDLIDKACLRVIQDGRKNLFAEFTIDTFVAVADKLDSHPDRAYILGGGIAKYMASEKRPLAKLDLLLPLIQALRQQSEPKLWVKNLLEAVVLEMFSIGGAFRDVLGGDSDLGDNIAIIVRLLASDQALSKLAKDEKAAASLPNLKGVLRAYQILVAEGYFSGLSSILIKQFLVEIKGPKRLRPSSPAEELVLFRAIVKVMDGYGRDEAERDNILEALNERSKMLVAADFVEALTSACSSAFDELEALITLCENVIGTANKRQAGRWLFAALGSVKFEREMRDEMRSVAQRLAGLAQLQQRAMQLSLGEADAKDVFTKLGAMGALIAQDVNLIPTMVRASPDPMKRLTLMLGFASGQTGPIGPVSDQAKAEVLKVLRNADVRKGLTGQPQTILLLRTILTKAEAAA